MKSKNKNIITRNKDVTAVFVVTAALLMIPLIGMQVSSEWDWNLTDFIVAGTLLASFGLLMVFAKRKIKNTNRRIAVIIALMALLLLIYAHLAVGIVDSWLLAGS